MRYLLDTNVLSEPLKITPDPAVMAKLEQHEGDVAIASPVWHELRFGACRLPTSRKRRTIEAFLDDVIRGTVRILPYDQRAAELHAQERARLTRQGRTPSFVDGQIAAIARATSLVLVTRNVADFSGFQQLRAECWHSS